MNVLTTSSEWCYLIVIPFLSQEEKIKTNQASSSKQVKNSPAKKLSKTSPSTWKDVVKKVPEAVGKKISAVSEKKGLKRKVTGAGMFQSSWTRGAQRDTEDYRNGYPVSLPQRVQSNLPK